ncbi:hypothetical protein WME89_02365 [Sorangium sp. So ce321]|uniref:hypothetical protein n=1 Tax=Sorangium sp. So ce321 TaxID=3133300 RepID=UPI003F6287EF
MTAAQTLARAFHEDPFICWAEPDPVRRPRTMTTVFGAMLAHADRHGGRLFEPGVGSVDWKPPAHAGMGLGDVLRSGLWRVMLEVPPAVWWRLSAHEDAGMARVRPFLGAGAGVSCRPGSIGPASPDRRLEPRLAEVDRSLGVADEVILSLGLGEGRAAQPPYACHLERQTG